MQGLADLQKCALDSTRPSEPMRKFTDCRVEASQQALTFFEYPRRSPRAFFCFSLSSEPGRTGTRTWFRARKSRSTFPEPHSPSKTLGPRSRRQAKRSEGYRSAEGEPKHSSQRSSRASVAQQDGSIDTCHVCAALRRSSWWPIVGGPSLAFEPGACSSGQAPTIAPRSNKANQTRLRLVL